MNTDVATNLFRQRTAEQKTVYGWPTRYCALCKRSRSVGQFDGAKVVCRRHA